MNKAIIILAALGLYGIAFTLTAVAWAGRQAARWARGAWVLVFAKAKP